MISSADDATTAASEDPGTFAMTKGGALDWWTYTLAVHPAGTGAGVATPGVITTTTTMPASTQVGPAVPTPGVITTTTTIPAPAAVGGAVENPGVVVTTTTMPASTQAGGGVATPGVITTTTTMPQASAFGGSQPGVATPATIVTTTVINPPDRAGAGTLTELQGTSPQSHWDALGDDLKAEGIESGEIVGGLNEFNDTVGVGYWEARKQALGLD
jgi:hypothetical protein